VAAVGDHSGKPECFLDEAYFLGVLRIKLNICVLFN
jgi:hypothetical protein